MVTPYVAKCNLINVYLVKMEARCGCDVKWVHTISTKRNCKFIDQVNVLTSENRDKSIFNYSK